MFILIEALKGGMAELRDCPDFSTRLSTAARHAKLIAEDLAGQVALIPFALRALSERSRAKREGRLLVGLRYGPRERQVADLWLPGAAAGEKREKGQRPPAIAVLFHGGTWTAGDKWNVGPAASHLSRKCGCVVVVPNYSLYDSHGGLGISASVEDAVDAVKWAGTAAGEEKAGEERETSLPSSTTTTTASSFPSSHGGDPTRLAVLGHSAGAHLTVAAAMVLAAEREGEGEAGGESKPRTSKRHSLPSAVVSLAGPFDLPSHFEHEAKRGVHRLSTMARAAATPASFAMEAVERSSRGGGEEEGGKDENTSSSYSSLFFDAAPEGHRASLVALSPLAALDPEASLAGRRLAAGPLAGVAEAAAAAAAAKRGRKQKDHHPRFLFISSAADVIVPSSSSAALHSALVRENRDSMHVEYPLEHGVGHADFVVRRWGGDGSGSGEGGEGEGNGAPWAAKVEAVVSSL